MIADSGYCSRRKAEELISNGRVKMNGRPIKLGDKCTYMDLITIDGERIYLSRKKNFIYLMMNKPRGYVTTVSDELDRKCVTDLLQGLPERVYPNACSPQLHGIVLWVKGDQIQRCFV